MIKKFALRPRNFRCDLSIATATLVVVASGLNILPYTTVTERFVVNTTASMPVGVYRLTDQSVVKGAIVGACIPESYATLAKSRDYLGSGSCPSGLRPVMKHVAAVAGDEIAISAKEVSVNGEALANTRSLRLDANGQPLPNQFGRHIVADGQYWLISNTDIGCFDSRYFGPVTTILGVVEPLLTRNTLCKLHPFNNFIRCSGEAQ